MLIIILLSISLILNILGGIYFWKSFNLLKSYENIITEFREKIDFAESQLENIDHKEYFEEHDSIGLAFKVIRRIYYDLNNFLK